MRKFNTGATRNLSDHKLQYSGFLSAKVLRKYGEYMKKHAIQSDGTIRPADNWKKGIPLDTYKDSLVRHTIDFWRLTEGEEVLDPDNGKRVEEEELLCAIMFNSMGYLYELIKKY